MELNVLFFVQDCLPSLLLLLLPFYVVTALLALNLPSAFLDSIEGSALKLVKHLTVNVLLPFSLEQSHLICHVGLQLLILKETSILYGRFDVGDRQMLVKYIQARVARRVKFLFFKLLKRVHKVL